MPYIDLGTSNYSKKYRKSKQKNHRWVQSTAFLFTLILAIFGLKLLLQPVSSAVGSLWRQSGLMVSGIIRGPRALKQDEGVTNILLIGIDKRSSEPYSVVSETGKEVKRGFLADTIMIASYHHQNKKLSLLSVPRDLYVKIPAFGNLNEQFAKINAAYSLGDQFNYPGGGAALLRRVLEKVLGIPVHYYVRTDFAAFEKGVDAIGGIDIEVENSFDDFMYPKEGFENAPSWGERYQYIHFDKGLRHMDGTTALKFARSRHALGAEGSDFARAKRQQKVILAAKNKILTSETLFNSKRLKKLYLALSENIATDVQLGELPLFYRLAREGGQNKVDSFVLDGSHGKNGFLVNPNPEGFGGAWVLIPRAGVDKYQAIWQFVRKIFYNVGQ